MTSPSALFGLLILERDPFGYEHFWGLLQAWLQDAGGFAFFGLIAYIIYAVYGVRTDTLVAATAARAVGVGEGATQKYVLENRDQITSSHAQRNPVSGLMLTMFVLSILTYAGYIFLLINNIGPDTTNNRQFNSDPTAFIKYVPPKWSWQLQPLLLTLGGLFAVIGIGEQFLKTAVLLSPRRIFALGKLGYKEAIRSRLLWVFLLFLIPFLFPITWFVSHKPEQELRLNMSFASLATQILLLTSAALLASMAIPSDIKNQNIYTIATKPVIRFEIVLGRFIGYGFVMTLALLAMTGLGWLLIYGTNINEKAASETYMARLPVRGTLSFASRRGAIEGTNVGREFDYRKYIGGDPTTSQRAIWSFRNLPSSLASGRDAVPCEFTFDIFRMTKGEENRGVDLTVRVTTWQCPQTPPTEPKDGTWKWVDAAKYQEYLEAAKAEVKKLGGSEANPAATLAAARPGTPAWAAVNKLAEQFGFYEVSGKEIFDYHPDSIPVPSGLFANAAAPQKVEPGKEPYPPVTVFVKCNTRGQMLGMADADLYLLENDPVPSAGGFAKNYFKASVGLWCRLLLILGLAIVCSTYLPGVLTLLVAAGLFLSGFFTEHIADIASGKSYVGGPFKAINQLLEAKPTTMPLDETSPLTKVTVGGDQAFAWVVRRFVNVVPDIDSYTWTHFLAEGFNIPTEFLVMNVVVLVGYLLPWFVLGFYLIRSRELAA